MTGLCPALCPQKWKSKVAAKGHHCHFPWPCPTSPRGFEKAEIQSDGLAGWGRGHVSGACGYYTPLPCDDISPVSAAGGHPQVLRSPHRAQEVQASTWKLDSMGHRWHCLALTGLGPRQSPGWDSECGHVPSPTTLVPVFSSLSVPSHQFSRFKIQTDTDQDFSVAWKSGDVCSWRTQAGVQSDGVPWVARLVPLQPLFDSAVSTGGMWGWLRCHPSPAD